MQCALSHHYCGPSWWHGLTVSDAGQVMAMWGGVRMPIESTQFQASAGFMSEGDVISSGTILTGPPVGFGAKGMSTTRNFFAVAMSTVSAVTNPTWRLPVLGSMTNTTRRN